MSKMAILISCLCLLSGCGGNNENPPSGTTDLAASLRTIVRNIKRRSLVVIISDLIDDPEQTLRAIRLIGSHRHDVVVFHVQDPAELEFSFDGSALLRDMETGEQIEVPDWTIYGEGLAGLTTTPPRRG